MTMIAKNEALHAIVPCSQWMALFASPSREKRGDIGVD